VAPFVLQYRDVPAATWNNIIVGIIVAILAIYRALEKVQPFQQQRSAH
jgi:hypothetical protein